jgi:hypothetical protein
MKERQNGRQIALAVCAALAAFAVGLAGPSAALAGAPSSSTGQWRVAARTPGFLDAIVSPTATSAWAFGWIGKNNGLIAPVTRQWNGQRWSSATLPGAVKDSGVACAAASSPGNVWAFFGAGASLGNPPGSAGALSLQNGQWVPQKTFPGSYVTGCNVLGASDIWVFGGEVAGLGPGVGTWHLTSSGWTSVNTGNLVLFRASVVSATDIWAAAADVSGALPMPMVATWNGSAWVENRSISAVLPKPTSKAGVGIAAINALSARNVWVQAFVEGQARIIRIIVVHWNGSSWSQVKPTSFGYHLPNAVPDGQGGWWAPPFTGQPSTSYLLHGVNGHWTRFPLPITSAASLNNFVLTHVPNTALMFAAGESSQGGVILVRG